MDAPHEGDKHGKEHPGAICGQDNFESPPPYTPSEQTGYTGNDVGDIDDAEASTAGAVVAYPEVNKKGKDSEKRRGLLGKLKKIEDKLIGTEEERAQQRAEREREKEEDRKRQELAYQKAVKRQREFYAEREARQRQAGPVALGMGDEFLNWNCAT
ncbi:hypothetical protein PENSPDRAFT_651897 [Peniophora sp. CONT]|nr:hypothetical protein PENSPDRAFT_651897 [Peniophora sp. CONT]